MARVEVVMPKMGESIMEGTVIEWTKSVGDTIEQDETLLEIATDKVDSEVLSLASGVLVEILAVVNNTIEVSNIITIIKTDASAASSSSESKSAPEPVAEEPAVEEKKESTPVTETSTEKSESTEDSTDDTSDDQSEGKFYSPLVRSIA